MLQEGIYECSRSQQITLIHGSKPTYLVQQGKAENRM